MSYTKSLLDTNYKIVGRRQEIVETARLALKNILQDGSVKLTFDSERSLLNDGLNSLEKYLNEISLALESLEDISDLPNNISKDSDDSVIENFLNENEKDSAKFINILYSGINQVSAILTNVVSTTGVLPSDYKNFTNNSLVIGSIFTKIFLPKVFGFTFVVLTAATFGRLMIELISDDSFNTKNIWDESVSPFYVNIKDSITEKASIVYNSYIVPIATTVVEYFSQGKALEDYEDNILGFINEASLSILYNGLPSTLFNVASNFINSAGNLIGGVYNDIKKIEIFENSGVTKFLNNVEDAIGKGSNIVLDWISNFVNSSEVKNTISAINNLLGALIPDYKNGVTETRYGRLMEQSWGIFTSTIQNDPNFNVNFLTTTPLDPSENANFTIYGNMMLGAPLMYTRQTDPNNRTMINTFVKDSIFLSLTPGMPKYNGGAFQQELISGFQSSYLTQTQTAEEMRNYLLKNGIDQSFANKDKRYYTFDANYEEYYAYLETMLNTMWIKMGLSATEDEKFNIFSFFTGNQTTSLQPKYKSSIGFYVNPVGDISEAISNTTFSSGLEDDANTASSKFQNLNFITGMGSAVGTAGKIKNLNRQYGIAGMQLSNLGNVISSNINTGLNRAGRENSLFSIGGAIGIANSISKFFNTQDISAVVQQFSVTNGMKVQYPQLWESSDYSKNMNFTFNFVSPYGDPLSIFQYVYVPFFSLLAMAMPRQAAENGLVSPFFVRADIPGWITSDLALITDITWQKGGSDQSLWTKDKLPRAISGSFTVTDLYPYLSSVKRLSFLSANPSFTVFLDNMAGLRALYNETQDDPFLEYWDNLINRVNGQRDTNELWNRFSQDRKTVNNIFAKTVKESQTRSINKKAMPWLSRI